MFYQLYELQRLAAAPLAGLRVPGRMVPPWQRPAWALAELLARGADAVEPRLLPIESAVAAEIGAPVEAQLMLATPFVRVMRLVAGAGTRHPTLLLAPHSGYSAAVLAELVARLLVHGEVWVTDWIDARLVPAGKGAFRLADQVAASLAVMAGADRPLHLVGLSQSVPAAMLAATAGPAPASLLLLGGPAEPRLSPTPLQRSLAMLPRRWLLSQCTSQVATRHPGAGRQVFPAALQLAGYAASTPRAYLGVQLGMLAELAVDSPNGWARQYDAMHRLLDVPAELFADTLDHALGAPVALGPAAGHAGIRLLTVEAAADSLIGPGQTHAAHGRLAGHGFVPAGSITLPGADHHDLFTGPGFAQGLAMMLDEILGRLDG